MQNIYMALYRAMIEWNSLDVQTRNSVSKSSLGTVLKSQIVNPYMKVLKVYYAPPYHLISFAHIHHFWFSPIAHL